MEDAQIEHPSADKTKRLGLDEFIRDRHGYSIKSRPNKGENIWERNGVLFTQSAILKRENMDEYLIACGYKLKAKLFAGSPGPTLWEKDGEPFTKLEALVNEGLLTEGQAAEFED